MAEKLKSILKRISWSSLLKAVIFAVAWWASPFLSVWLFLLVALYLHFIPIQGTGKVSVPFFVLLLISVTTAPDLFTAILFGAIFYFILLIKDLIIIDRRSAYEILILVLSYLVVRDLFVLTGGTLGARASLASFVAAIAISMMCASFIKHFSEAPPSFRRMLGWMSFLLLWQLAIVGLVLPLDFLYQSAVVFLIAAVLIDIVPQYIFGELSRTKMLATGTVIFGLLVIVLASARWVL